MTIEEVAALRQHVDAMLNDDTISAADFGEVYREILRDLALAPTEIWNAYWEENA